jgi:predicted DNA-binding transcriptional regulator AlpA
MTILRPREPACQARTAPKHHHAEAALSSTSKPEPEASAQWMTDRLISVQDIRTLFRLGRTAAYELTHRSDFPDPVVISPRCYRWWASEVTAFAIGIRSEQAKPRRPASCVRDQPARPCTQPMRINGTVRVARTRRTSP